MLFIAVEISPTQSLGRALKGFCLSWLRIRGLAKIKKGVVVFLCSILRKCAALHSTQHAFLPSIGAPFSKVLESTTQASYTVDQQFNGL